MANAVADTGTLVDNLTYNYGSNNRLSSVNDAAGQIHNWDAFSSSFDYDANGNMISQSGKFTNIAYDHRNLPVHFYLEGADELIANYNAEGQRILKESSGGAWSFYITDGMQTLAVIEDDTLRYMNLVGNDTFGRLLTDKGTVSLSEARRYYLKDHLGSTRVVVGNDGFLKETHDFYPFGLTMPRRSKGEALTREQFTGQLRDNEAGFNLDYFGARYYDQVVPRFTTYDPILGEQRPLELLEMEPRLLSTTPYGYVFGNPVNYQDPDGRCPSCFDFLRTAFSLDRSDTYLNELFRADQQGQLEQKIVQDVKDTGMAVAERTVKDGILTADFVSDASTVVAGAGIAAAPFTKGTSLGVSGVALSVGTVADVASLSLKAVDYTAFGGSGEAVLLQGGATITRGVGGQLVQSASARMVTRSGSAVTGPAFRSAQTGRFVSNRFGNTITAASDATRVVINVAVPNQPIRR